MCLSGDVSSVTYNLVDGTTAAISVAR
jgi:hypothetical protein